MSKFDKKSYQREYMRDKRKKDYAVKQRERNPAIGEDKGEDGRYPDREYNEDGTLKLFEQRCQDGCGGVWSASITIPCPYCRGSGKMIPRTNHN